MPKFRIHNLLLSMGVWLGSSVALAEDITPPKEYLQWLETLKTEMIERGISEDTIEEVYEQSYYHPKPEVVKIDRNQTEFVLTFTDYVNRVVNKKKVENKFGLFKQNHYICITNITEGTDVGAASQKSRGWKYKNNYLINRP